MSIIPEHLPFYREMFAVSGFWREKFLMIGLPYIQGDRLPPDFNFKDLQQLAQAQKLKQVYSVDLFDTNADYQWDLNLPVPLKFHNAFQTVFDIGTLEHIYDTKQCLENYLRLVKVGGLFALVTPINGYFGHGFHVFNPHTIIDALEQNGFSIEYQKYSTSTGLEISDPSIRKNILLFIVARKTKKLTTFKIPQQQYWADIYETKSEHYADTTMRQASQFDTLTLHLKNLKRAGLMKLPLATRTWMLNHLR